MARTFVLGMGAQKSGTTWLSQYLSLHHHYKAGFTKEYHAFDVHDIPVLARNRYVLHPGLKGAHLLAYKMQNETGFYFSYFNGLLSNVDSLAADITPSYSGLSAQTLDRIRSNFLKHNIAVKCVFIMRDPIERCASAVRMNIARGYAGEGFDPKAGFEKGLLDYVQSEHAKFRTRYDITIGRIREVFPKEDQFIGLYETLFSKPEINRLSAFLGMEPRYDMVEKKIFSSPGTREVSQDTARKIAKIFRKTYVFCAKEYPATKNLWLGNSF